MVKPLSVVLGCLVVACGPNFAGTYSGTLAYAGPCTDGSSVSTTATSSWAATQAGSAVTATFSGACSPLTWMAAGSVLTLQGKSCPQTASGAWTFAETLNDGRATLNGSSLDLVMHSTLVGTSAGGSATCNVTASGVLSLQQ